MSCRRFFGLLWLGTGIALLTGATSASAQGVVPNPEFDTPAVAGWSGDVATVAWSDEDPDCVAPDASGSLLLSPDSPSTPATAFLCVPPPPVNSSGEFHFTYLVRAECEEVVTGTLRFYPQPGCGGTLLGSTASGGTTPGNSWDEAAIFGVQLLPGTQSIWIGLGISEATSQICTTRFDRIHLGAGIPLLRSGFETGSSACRWSATVP